MTDFACLGLQKNSRLAFNPLNHEFLSPKGFIRIQSQSVRHGVHAEHQMNKHSVRTLHHSDNDVITVLNG